MRVATLSRTDLGKRHVRLDPSFYVGRELVRSTMSAEGSRHVRLGDIIESIHDGARLPSAESGIPMLRLNNVRPCELDLSGMTHVDGTAGKWDMANQQDMAHCMNWTNNVMGSGNTGVTDLNSGNWTAKSAVGCDSQARLYCIEEH